MNHSDFHIGLVFMDCTGWWRCTDVGTRTILAIRLDHDDPHWYEGPPYNLDVPLFITKTNARELFGLRPGETVAQAVARKASEG
ncbi:hypothetical protein WT54_19625 [Burkholderia territorii]|nr:hypothetical protein WT54_19625 [Burkholderia territorii]